jgi:porin
VERVTGEAVVTPEQPLIPFDRPLYRAFQDVKKDLGERYGINFAVEDTLIYQAASGGVDPNDAMVNTLGFFSTWKIIRSDNEKDFAGLGFQAEVRGNHTGEFTDLRNDLGSLWSINDSTSDDYSKINQFWWGQRFGDGKLGYLVGKIDPGTRINQNRFAGSGNTQFFGQPFATNPARSFPDNGLGLMLRYEPVEWLYLHFTMSDSDAISTHSPFTTLNGRWLYAGEIGYQPVFDGLGQGIYRLMIYGRDTKSATDEIGVAVSIDQNLSDDLGVFFRYGGNDGGINAIRHLLAVGVSFLNPFGRSNDLAGVGVSFTYPSDSDLRDEYAVESYYRLQLTEGVELSPDVQVIFDPSAGGQDVVGVFGMRLRLLY